MTNHFDKMTSWKRARAASEESAELAEGVGFEPTVGFPTLDFESSALNRTQPPFLQSRRNAERVTSNIQRPMQLSPDWAFSVGRWTLSVYLQGKPPASHAPPALGKNTEPRAQSTARVPEKCYNFWLATANPGAAYCITAGELRYYLLSVTDWNSQVVGAAVRKY